MVNYINRNNVIQAIISEPISSEDNIYGISHGWQLKLIVGFQSDGMPNFIVIDYKSKDDCVKAINKLKLTEL
jgi:subtilase family serine protease